MDLEAATGSENKVSLAKQQELRAPFPWFGGKRRVADVGWRAFGSTVPNMIEPFAGSLAVLLARPGGAGKIETVNDRDRYLANFWRAVIADPYAVAAWADRPVNEADLHATHLWLVNQTEFRERMHMDPDYFDAKIAGLWVNGLCCWIGGGWCVEPRTDTDAGPARKIVNLTAGGSGIGTGVNSERAHGKARNLRSRTRPRMSGDNVGQGVHSARTRGAERHTEANRPELAGAGKGINSQHLPQKLPMLAVKADGACAGRGVLSEAAVRAYSPGVHLPSLGNDRGIHGVASIPGTFMHALAELSVPDAPPAFEWFRAIMLRMRRVRVACGDWRRVLGDSVLGKGKNVGGRRPCAVFLDAPYAHEYRDPCLYSEDDPAISAQVADWAREHGDDPDLRIALCGYDGEHTMPSNWTVHAWKGARGYAKADNNNRSKERIWFSPHCLPIEQQRSLFEGVGT